MSCKPDRLPLQSRRHTFHAVTAYGILRTRGVPLGKRNREGWLRTKPAWGAVDELLSTLDEERDLT